MSRNNLSDKKKKIYSRNLSIDILGNLYNTLAFYLNDVFLDKNTVKNVTKETLKKFIKDINNIDKYL